MKKIVSLIIAAVMLISLPILAGCAGAPNGDSGLDAPGYNAENKADLEDGQAMPTEGEYGKLIENEFISTEKEPISTFSADVDTASYSYFRKMVNQGYDLENLIRYAGSSFRTEEMINYFKYDYALPEDGDIFGVTAKAAPCPWNSNAVLLALGLRTEQVKTATSNNLVFLIDVSGSMMSDDKLPLLKKAFSNLTDQLGDDDMISIVTYSGKEEVVLDGCEGTKKAQILSAVNSLKASGSTNGEAGLRMAYDIAKKHFITGGNNRIIMASDGDLNVGISSAEGLKNFVSEKKNEGVYISVLGFGTGNYRDSNMEAIADNGNGIYYYIDGEREAEKVFGTDLLGTLYTVAEDVKLQLTFDKDYIDSYRLVGYENRILNKEDFENDKKDAGEIGAGHMVTVCYELILTEKAKTENDGDWMKLAMRYKAPGTTESILREYSIGKSIYTETPDEDFRFICAVAETSMILHESKYVDELGLDDVLTKLSALDLSKDADKSEFADLIRELVSREQKKRAAAY